MSNRDGGRYDSAGNYWPPYPNDPPLWKRIVTNGIAIALGLILLAGVCGMVYLSATHPGDDYRDGYDGPIRADQFHNR